MNRAERRRRARALAKQAAAADARPVAGIYYDTGELDSTSSLADLPPKVPGRHRWTVVAGYVITEAQIETERAVRRGEVRPPSVLDHENRFLLAIGCYDCERSVEEIGEDEPCPA